MKNVFCREEPKKLKEIREELLAGRPVKVHNQYETVYGWGFGKWLRKGIEDIPCDIEESDYNHFADGGYPWTYLITPKSK